MQVQASTTPGILQLHHLRPNDLQQLQQNPAVKYIDQPARKAVEELELKDSDLSANTVAAVHALYPNLAGQGVVVSVKENPFDTTDIDFKNRYILSPAFDEPHALHATTMATIIGGGGNSSPLAKGVAWQSTLTSSSFANLMPDDTEQLLQQEVSVQNHSYGVGVENYYGLESMAYDEQVHKQPHLLHIFSSGNSGTATPETGTYAGLAGFANLTGQFKTSKNTLSIGALNTDGTVGELSSVGPAYDGRIKPELVAHGVGGTSEAAAVASGVAALLQQAYLQQHNTLPSAALVKALLINSADDAGEPNVDFESGYGNIDALGAMQTLQEERHFTGSLSQGQQQQFTLEIPSGVQELKLTLVWHDPAATPDAPKALVHDLDLRLRHLPSGQQWLPWVLSAHPHPDSLQKSARRGPDHLNNIEQVTLQQPNAGTYTIDVTAFDLPAGASQQFYLAYEYSTGLTFTYPSLNTTLLAGQTNRIRWSGQAAGTASLYFRNTSTSSGWQLIADDVNLTQGYYDWTAPAELAQAQLKLEAPSQTMLSEVFILSGQTQARLTLNCEGQTLLQWPALAGAAQYQVYSLSGSHLQPLRTTSDTLIVFTEDFVQAQYFAVAPIVGGVAGINSLAEVLNPQQSLCYTLNFLPEQPVMETVLFNLDLSTTYGLQQVTLERLEQGAFQAVQTQTTPQQRYLLHDPTAAPGLNRYRARIQAQGQVYYSQEEEIFFTSPGYVQVAPNPVATGQEVQVIAYGEGSAQLQLYNMLGQLVYSGSDSGTIKTLPTQGLAPGMYTLRVLTDQGNKLSTRLLVQ